MADNNTVDTVYDDGRLLDLLRQGADSLGVSVEDDMAEAFLKYATLLRERNKVMNLTNILDDEGVARLHFVDSLTLVPYIRDEQKSRGNRQLTMIDVGTGAGFPGIPLKIVMSELKVTLLDSLNKRIAFLDDVIAQTSVKGIRTVHMRAEDGGQDKKHRECYDIATARAVASLPVLCEYCLPFVKTGGVFLAMKGHSAEETEEAAKAISILGGRIEKAEEFMLPGSDVTRSVVVIRKVHNTPARFPRQAGKPSKSPIT